MIKTLMLILLSLTACTPKVTPVAYDCPVLELPADPILYYTRINNSTSLQTASAWLIHDFIVEKGWNTAVREQNQKS